MRASRWRRCVNNTKICFLPPHVNGRGATVSLFHSVGRWRSLRSRSASNHRGEYHAYAPLVAARLFRQWQGSTSRGMFRKVLQSFQQSSLRADRPCPRTRKRDDQYKSASPGYRQRGICDLRISESRLRDNRGCVKTGQMPAANCVYRHGFGRFIWNERGQPISSRCRHPFRGSAFSAPFCGFFVFPPLSRRRVSRMAFRNAPEVASPGTHLPAVVSFSETATLGRHCYL